MFALLRRTPIKKNSCVIAMSQRPNDSSYLVTCAKDSRTISRDTYTYTGEGWGRSLSQENCHRPVSRRIPKWYKCPVGESYGFGGKFFSRRSSLTAGKSSEVFLYSILMEDSFVSRSSEFEAAIRIGEWSFFRVLCDNKSQQSESAEDRETWGFLKVMFEEDRTARKKLLTPHFGFRIQTEEKENLQDDMSQDSNAFLLEDSVQETLVYTSNNEPAIFTDNGEDFFSNLPSPKPDAPLATSKNNFLVETANGTEEIQRESSYLKKKERFGSRKYSTTTEYKEGQNLPFELELFEEAADFVTKFYHSPDDGFDRASLDIIVKESRKAGCFDKRENTYTAIRDLIGRLNDCYCEFLTPSEYIEMCEQDIPTKSQKSDKKWCVGKLFKYSDCNIGYAYIHKFKPGVSNDVLRFLRRLITMKVNYTVFDVRYNSGGYLTELVTILGFFFTKKEHMFTIKYNDQTLKYFGLNEQELSMNLAVIVDQDSASAAEMLAWILNYHKKACVYGGKTYGKFIGQMCFRLQDKSAIQLTGFHWEYPSGQHMGSNPEMCVSKSVPESLKFDESFCDNMLSKPGSSNYLDFRQLFRV